MRVFPILIAMTICGGASAKCIAPIFDLSGTVRDWEGRAVPGAAIAVSWVERGRAQGPAITRSDRDGRYSLKIVFNTYTKGSWFRGDICKEELTNVAVSAFAPGLGSDSERIAVNSSTFTANLSLKATAPDGAAP